MTIARPKWLDYAVYEDHQGIPVLIGFKKDTPKEIIDAYKKDQQIYRDAEKDGIIL